MMTMVERMALVAVAAAAAWIIVMIAVAHVATYVIPPLHRFWSRMQRQRDIDRWTHERRRQHRARIEAELR
jgi:hypothetical protein